jgi:hypothetical protein
MRELDTPHGPARAHLHLAGDARGVLGAGAGVGAPDLVLATEVANGLGIAAALGRAALPRRGPPVDPGRPPAAALDATTSDTRHATSHEQLVAPQGRAGVTLSLRAHKT